MDLYQYAKITGVAFKLLFPEGTTPEATPVQWAMGYSNVEIMVPELQTERLQTLATYQTSSCQARRPVTRFFRTGAALARQGVEWFNTEEYSFFNGVDAMYNQQLTVDQGASTNIKVFRPRTNSDEPAQLGRMQVTYYVTYKGMKGVSSLIDTA